MDKAVLVIDMPKCCGECRIRFDDDYSNWCPYDNPEPNGVYKYVENGTKPNWCPLRALPKHIVCFCEEDDYMSGYSDCLDKILRA